MFDSETEFHVDSRAIRGSKLEPSTEYECDVIIKNEIDDCIWYSNGMLGVWEGDELLKWF